MPLSEIMKTLFRRILTFLTLASFALLPATASAALKVAWTPYPSWQVLPAMALLPTKDNSFLAQRMKETGGKVEIVPFKEYVPSITSLVAGQIDACAMTIQEALSFPTDSGIPVTIILVTSSSNGNDAIFGPPGAKINDLVANGIILEEFSVSQFLVYEACRQNGIEPKSVAVRNTPGDEIAKVFLNAKKKPFVATWNPHVVRIQESGQATTLFTSKQMPGQIVDTIVIRNDRIKGNEPAIEAFVKAYFDYLNHWGKRENSDRALRALASTVDMRTPEDVELFRKTVETTRFYRTPAETVTLMEGPELRATHDKVRAALIHFGAFKGEKPESYRVAIDATWVKKAGAK